MRKLIQVCTALKVVELGTPVQFLLYPKPMFSTIHYVSSEIMK